MQTRNCTRLYRITIKITENNSSTKTRNIYEVSPTPFINVYNIRVAKTPPNYKPDLEDVSGQKIRKILLMCSDMESGNQLMNGFLKTETSLILKPG